MPLPSRPTERLLRIAARARALAVVYFLLLFLGTHLPIPGAPESPLSDKWLHFTSYAILTLLVLTCWELTIGRLYARHYFAVWLVGIAYGAIDEWTQIPVGRTCDMNDWAADVFGIIVGIVVYQLLRPLMFAVIDRDDDLA